MPEGEVRYPCPVCLGAKLSKVRLGSADDLTLDRCERCGGIWFDEGEVALTRRVRLDGTRGKIELSAEAFRMSCHACQAVMDRNAEKCPACGWENRLDCPVCERTMKRREVEGLHLDFCTACRGVWFDQIELAEIWNLRAEAFERTRGEITPVVAGAAEVGAEILFWNPELAVWAGRAVLGGGRAVAAGVSHAAAAAPRAIGGALEATGDLAGTVFEAIATIVGSIFD